MAKPVQIFSKPWAYARAEKDAPHPPMTQTYVGSGRTSLDNGFPDETMKAPAYGGIPPYGQDMNGILKSITENLCYYSAGGLFEYDNKRDYDAPAIVSHKGKIYRCVAANTALAPITPGTNSNYWLHIMDETDVKPIMSSFSGMIGWFAGTTAPTDDWLVANGQEVSRTIYKGLFDYFGTLYGEGDGVTTFNLPNLVDRVAWGADVGIGTYVEAGLPNITGNGGFFERTNPGEKQMKGAFFVDETTKNNLGSNDSDWDNFTLAFDASLSNPIYGNSETVQPPAVKLLPCIHA